MSESATAPAAFTNAQRLRAILGGSAGNLVEWYDWFAYASFSLYFAPVFFPDGDKTAQLMQTAAVFAVGFFAFEKRFSQTSVFLRGFPAGERPCDSFCVESVLRAAKKPLGTRPQKSGVALREAKKVGAARPLFECCSQGKGVGRL